MQCCHGPVRPLLLLQSTRPPPAPPVTCWWRGAGRGPAPWSPSPPPRSTARPRSARCLLTFEWFSHLDIWHLERLQLIWVNLQPNIFLNARVNLERSTFPSPGPDTDVTLVPLNVLLVLFQEESLVYQNYSSENNWKSTLVR